MSNSFGRLFRVTTWGESHGPALGTVIDGCPAGLALDENDLKSQFIKDVPDKEIGTPRGEKNVFQILSGVFEGKTLGTPISIIIFNNDARPSSYESMRNTLRPGHADFTYLARYGHTDWRGGSRASGRECIARLAAGGVAHKLASTAGVSVNGRVIELAGLSVSNDESFKKAKERVLKIGKTGDSTGGIVEIIIKGFPAGVGNPVFGKLHADLAQAFFSIGGIKGIELGAGFESARKKGSELNDPFAFDIQNNVVLLSNNCGGVLGGISTGDDIVFRLAVKPTPTISNPQKTVNISEMKVLTAEYKGRFDRNFTPRVVPIAEAMGACIAVDHLLQNGVINSCQLG